MGKKYYIVGFYNNKKEYLDTAETFREATKLLLEYSMAYGPSWTIDIILK